MQIVTRTLTILVAALLVVGATMALGQSGALSSLSSGGPPASSQVQATSGTDAAASDSTTMGAPPARGGNHEEGGMSLAGAVSIGKNLGIIGAIVAVIALATGLVRRLLPWTRGRGEPPPAAA
ncbi:MAG: hypothetical protein HGA45_16860 [Chloroflexales bacterium]|nr:hypothetical protein [Chloroflexales bacterium]